MRQWGTVTFLSFCVVLVGMTFSAPPAEAYLTYSAGQVMHPPGSSRCRDTDTEGCSESFGNCKTCHGHFRATDEDNSRPMLRDEYISPADGRTWREVYQEVENDEPELEVGLHDIHRHIMLDKLGRSRCDACHFGPREERFRVYLFLSNGSEGLEPISCLGCHGRPGEGAAGLRQHHSNSGVSECKTCHPDADPSSYIPLGEDVLPSYYAAPNDVFVNKPTDPCSQAGDEDYAGGPKALDNDGDGRYDMADLDCHPTGPGNNNGK